ncbi:MAG: tetratricopeptide repeat protein [Bacteroidetes bacterium]|nr:tetratricopeptide repeat protein [Bacteroidota bacterium]MCH7770428.1 tetratricopeptide repeat protein [Bacteroidota bacterium]
MSDRLKSLLELYSKDPNDSFVVYGIALEHISAGNYEQAEKYLTSLMERDPDYVPAYMQLARVKENLNRIEEAKEVYRNGIDVAKKNNELRTATEMEEFLSELE